MQCCRFSLGALHLLKETGEGRMHPPFFFLITTNPQPTRLRISFFRVDYMGICGLDGRSRAPRDRFMASHIIDTEQLRVAKPSFDGNQVLFSTPVSFTSSNNHLAI